MKHSYTMRSITVILLVSLAGLELISAEHHPGRFLLARRYVYAADRL